MNFSFSLIERLDLIGHVRICENETSKAENVFYELEEKMRIVLGCGKKSVRKRVCHMLSSESEIAVIAVNNYDDIITETRRLIPDAVILLTDERDGGKSTIDLARTIMESNIPSRLILMTENVKRDLVPAIKAGASGLISHSVNRSELLSALMVPEYQKHIRAGY
jgi:DNA-binding NarL/FixJ family response regulator